MALSHLQGIGGAGVVSAGNRDGNRSLERGRPNSNFDTAGKEIILNKEIIATVSEILCRAKS